MKKILFMLTLINSGIIGYGQETEFKFTKDGLTDYIVTQCENKTQSEIYKKCIDWISFTYKNPQSVIQAKIENEYIRIEGVKSYLICEDRIMYGKLCNDGKYTLEISFKDGKYKFEIIKIEKFLEATNNRTGTNYPDRWYPIDIKSSEPDYFIYKKGKHKGEILNSYKYYDEIAINFNDLNKELSNFIMSENIPSKKSEW